MLELSLSILADSEFFGANTQNALWRLFLSGFVGWLSANYLLKLFSEAAKSLKETKWPDEDEHKETSEKWTPRSAVVAIYTTIILFSVSHIVGWPNWIDTEEKPKQDVVEDHYPSGALKYHATYNEDNKLHGMITNYYESGQMWKRYTFRNGIREGRAESWHPNGKRHFLGSYKNDLKEGKWYQYSASGEMTGVGTYSADELINVEWF